MSWMARHRTKTVWRALGLPPFLGWIQERRRARYAGRVECRSLQEAEL